MPDFLQKAVTVEEAEAANTYPPGRGEAPIPFGRHNALWRAFLAKMQSGDELWTFVSDEESWRNLAGRAGYAIVRNGEIVDEFITMLS